MFIFQKMENRRMERGLESDDSLKHDKNDRKYFNVYDPTLRKKHWEGSQNCRLQSRLCLDLHQMQFTTRLQQLEYLEIFFLYGHYYKKISTNFPALINS